MNGDLLVLHFTINITWVPMPVPVPVVGIGSDMHTSLQYSSAVGEASSVKEILLMSLFQPVNSLVATKNLWLLLLSKI
jgi:hypothetical protein